MIKRLTEPHEIVEIMKIEDNVEALFPCSRSEWVQWLMRAVLDNNLLILGSYNENNDLDGYAIARNNIFPPLSDHVYIMYVYAPKMLKDLDEGIRMIEAWAKKLGARKIRFATSKALVGKLHRFKETGLIVMEKIIDG